MAGEWKAMDNRYDEELALFKESIKRTLRILRTAIDDDNQALEDHYANFGDLYERTENTQGQMEPSKLLMEPLAGKYRLEIKSLLECVALIDQKLGGTKGTATLPEEGEGVRSGGKINPRKWGEKTKKAPKPALDEDE